MHLAIFDIDGTLTDTNVVDDECYARAIKEELGLHLPASWPSMDEITAAGVLRHLCEQKELEFDSQAEDRVTIRFVDLLRDACALANDRFHAIPGAPQVFAHLRSAGWDVAIATGGWRPSALFKLRSAAIPYEGVPLATSSEHHVRREIIRLAASSAGEATRESVVYVGDGVWDVRAALELGCAFLGVGNGVKASALVAAGAESVIPDFTDAGAVVDVLQRLRGKTF